MHELYHRVAMNRDVLCDTGLERVTKGGEVYPLGSVA